MPSGYRIFDAHCDTLVRTDLNGEKNQLRVSDMLAYPSYLQVFAICPEAYPAFAYTKEKMRRFARQTKKYALRHILTKEDLKAPYGAILALEGADALCGSTAALGFFYKKGVRLITVTWNNNNAAASSIASQEDGGLLAFGRTLVRACRRLGIAVDLSHIGDRGFWEVLAEMTAPAIVSHSNSRTLAPEYRRNITDGQFCAVVKNGGVVGVNYCADFLGMGRDMDAVIAHIEHFCALGGENNVGIGSDFDGVDALPAGCGGALFTGRIAERLLKMNYSEKTVRGIMGENFIGAFEKILPQSS